jgi:NAD(P)-dependent dehydrogenase (short-subunit alcohol dehydrogenase family)
MGSADRFSLQGKTAIITGGSRGIGLAIARAFVDAGASVALAARGQVELEEAASAIGATGGRAVAIPTDVTDEAQVQALVERTVRELGTVDILVNNAGAAPFIAPFVETRPDGFDKYFGVNFTSAVLCTRAVAPILLAKRQGCVLNVASISGLIATPGESYYGSAKAALIQFTRTIAHEWASANIRVNAIAPGWVDTPMNESIRSNPESNQAILGLIPLGRWGESEDIASAALYLCSPAASFVTGATLVVDGGQTMGAVTGL